MYASFDDSLITGNKMIDSQHKELIERINNLLIKAENKPDKVDSIKMLDHLAEYTEFHFKEEENLQKEIGYPGMAEHLKKHEELRQSVQELYDMLDEQEGPTDAFVEQVKKKVLEWLLSHIQGFDRSVAEYKYRRDNNDRL